jgi:CRISPR-associated protein Cst1
MTQPLLKWTGHPLADVGVATLCAMADKEDPAELTLEDLDDAGRELKSAYADSVFMSYLTCVFPNSAYVNPTMKGESREKAMQRLLTPHRAVPDEGVEGSYCMFSGEPATHLLERSQMPMLTGAGVMNFFPSGLSEMPVAAPYLLAIQALPLGGRRSEGKLLIVHCDDPQCTMMFVRKYLAKNRQIINLSQTNRLPATEDIDNLLKTELPGGLSKEKRPKYPDAKAPESLVMTDLVEVVSERKNALRNIATSVTVYHLSNSGQGPSLEIMTIPSQFVEFLYELETLHADKWKRLVHRAWRAGKGGADTSDAADADAEAAPAKASKKKKDKPAPPRGSGKSRNELYNDLLAIFEDGFTNWSAATRFVRRHLLSSDPLTYYFDPSRFADRPPRIRSADELQLIDWQLTALFLVKVLGMNQERIKLIKDFATRLAELVAHHNDRKLFQQLVFTAGEWQYRAILSKVQLQYAKDQGKLALGFDEYVDVFLSADESERAVWSLVRDLISIRLVERLFELKFFDRAENRAALENQESEAA